MANGELCIRCGYQETDHEHPEYKPGGKPCGQFKSEVLHHKNCPIIGCSGNCEDTIRDMEWRATCERHSRENALLVTPHGIAVIDIGS